MTVAELIEELKKYPQDLQVAVNPADPSWGDDPEIISASLVQESTGQEYNLATHKYEDIPVLKIGY